MKRRRVARPRAAARSASAAAITLLALLPAQPTRAVDCYTEIDPVYLETDPATLMQAHTAAEAASLRASLLDYLWPGQGLPGSFPAVTRDAAPPVGVVPSELPNLERIDEYEITMTGGFVSVAHHFFPVAGNDRLVILHQGHRPDVVASGIGEMLAFLLEQGFSVVTFLMPGFGPNVGPTLGHDLLEPYQTASFNPLSLFVEPVAAVLNYTELNYAYQDVSMMGHSGGGWTTLLYAAIDPRVRLSFPVAGTQPLYLREGPCGADGHYEAVEEGLYVETASYLDLYVLGAHGAGRKQLEVLRQRDWHVVGILYQTYETPVADRVRELGSGEFAVLLDLTGRGTHSLTAFPQAAIMRELGVPVWTVDEKSWWPGISRTGAWSQIEGVGYDGTIRRADTRSDQEQMRYQFERLPPGIYRVAATWVPGPELASDATYEITTTHASQLATVDQTAAPSDFVYQRTGWQTLAEVALPEGELEVELTALANGAVVADAVYAEWLEALDGDGDGVPDHLDNCLGLVDVSQRDTDQDGYGNACDADYTNDGLVSSSDVSVLIRGFGSSVGEPRYDPDLDRWGDGGVGSDALSLLLTSLWGPPGPSGLSCAGSVPCRAD